VPRATGASARDWIARSFTHVEDVLDVALGVLLAAGAVVLLADATLTFVANLVAGSLPAETRMKSRGEMSMCHAISGCPVSERQTQCR